MGGKRVTIDREEFIRRLSEALSREDMAMIEERLSECEEDDNLEEDEDFEEDWDSDDPRAPLADGTHFAFPGTNSALRAAGPGNPRNLPCPTCRAPNRLTPADRQRGYQCDSCADMAERGGY